MSYVNKIFGYNSYKDYVEKTRTKKLNVDVNKFALDINGKKLGIELPSNYDELISNISNIVNDKIKNEEIIKEDHKFAYKLTGMLDVDEVLELGEHFSKELSNKLYGSEVFVQHLHVYQNKITDSSESSSWLWHYDNCAPGQIKLMIYLTPTTKETGAFRVLKSAKEDSALLIESSRISPTETRSPNFPGSRLSPEVIQDLKNQGYEEYYIEGEPGTFVVFSQNTPHKATIPTEKPERICMIYNFRPYHIPLNTHISKNLTNDWSFTGDVKGYQYDI